MLFFLCLSVCMCAHVQCSCVSYKGDKGHNVHEIKENGYRENSKPKVMCVNNIEYALPCFPSFGGSSENV